MENIVKKLFSTHPLHQDDNAAYIDGEIPLFTEEELLTAVKNPQNWMTQRLVLISKSKGDQKFPGAYRPLCMLNTAGKLLEKLLKPRLAAAVQKAVDLITRQYGR